VEELYGTRYQSGSFSLNNVGSGFHCLRSFSFLFFSTGYCKIAMQLQYFLVDKSHGYTDILYIYQLSNIASKHLLAKHAHISQAVPEGVIEV
jgi:hypothetical protein